MYVNVSKKKKKKFQFDKCYCGTYTKRKSAEIWKIYVILFYCIKIEIKGNLQIKCYVKIHCTGIETRNVLFMFSFVQWFEFSFSSLVI